MTKIGLIGCGMWGRNLARNLAHLNVLAAVADRHDENAAEFAAANVWVAATYSAQQVTIEIADDGPGFAADIMSHLGEPYTSSRRAEAGAAAGEFGLGLGFFIARTLIRRSGGQVEPRNLKADEIIDMATPGGACVRISWPRKKLEQSLL